MRTKFLLVTLLAIFGLVSCNKDNEKAEPTPEIKIDIPTIVLQTPDAGTATASFSVNMPWTLTLTDTKVTPSWFTVDKMSGDAGVHTITLTITEVNPSISQIRIGYIKVMAGSSSSTITITQPASKGIDVMGVSLNKPTMSLVVGTTEILTAIVSPSNATNQTVIWSSSNPEVATVANGIVTAVNVGEATIKVRTESGNKEATCIITITNTHIAVTGLLLNKTATSLLVGSTETLTATVTPTNATNKNFGWSSSDPTIATVSSNGIVTASKAGTTIIKVNTEDGNKEATCTVTVENPVISVESIVINKNTTSMIVGGTETLTCTIEPVTATNKNARWFSSNESVATVSNGVVTAKIAGTATITVRTEDGNKEATCTVTVVVPVTSVSLNKSNTSIAVGSTETLISIINPATATNKNVTWSSSDSKIATVSTTGVVTAKAAGTTTITVITVDGSKRANCNVVVIDSSLPDRDNEDW